MVMALLDWIWVGLVIGVWVFTQTLVVLAFFRMWRRPDPEVPQKPWDDEYDHWYPDYPADDYRRGREKAVRLEPDKHEEEDSFYAGFESYADHYCATDCICCNNDDHHQWDEEE